MTTFSQNSSVGVIQNPRTSNISYIDIAYIAQQEIKHYEDRIEQRQEQENKQGLLLQNRPSLPAPNAKNVNYLMELAEAFGKAFSAMDSGVITESRDYGSLQQLDQTMSDCVLQSTENTVKQEIQTMQTQKQIQAYQDQQAKNNKILSDVFMAVGIVMMVVTVASMFVDAGSSAALLPEEMDMLEMTEITPQVADNMGSASADSSSAVSDSTDSVTNSADSSTSATTNSVDSSISSTTDSADQQVSSTTREVENSSAKTSQQNLNSIRNLNRLKDALKWGGKKVLGMGLGAAFGTPSLIRGLGQENVAHQLNDLAEIQSVLGKAMAVMQENNQYFQFYQQLVQRYGSVIQEETSDASEVIETYSDIVGAYRQITYGLANTV